MIKVNGKETAVAKEQSLLDFLEEKKLDLNKIVVEYNAEILSKEKLVKVVLQKGDCLEIVSFVGGG